MNSQIFRVVEDNPSDINLSRMNGLDVLSKRSA